jgi:hypothetical protein
VAEHMHTALEHAPCRNCEAPVAGAYCGDCGQERDTHRRSVFGLIRDLVEDIVSFDSRIMRTSLALLFEPGELPKAFREGRTHRYMPALRLYFFVSLMFFLILGTARIALVQLEVVATPAKITRDAQGNYFVANPSYDPSDKDTWVLPKQIPLPKDVALNPSGRWDFTTNSYFFSRIGLHNPKLTPAQRDQLNHQSGTIGIHVDVKHPQSAEAAKRAAALRDWIRTGVRSGVIRLAQDPAALNGPLTEWIPRMLFLLLPLYALVLALFYVRKRKEFYFVDHLIFSLSVHTFFFVLLIVAAALAQFLSGTLVFLFTMAVLGIYILIAMKRFYEQNWFWTVFKFLTVSAIYTVVFLFPALLTVFVISFTGG